MNPVTKALQTGEEGYLSTMMNTQPAHILLIEDDAINAELVHRTFEFHNGGQSLKVVGTIKEARAWLEQSVPDLVIAEWRLPDGTCLELVNGHKSDDAYPLIVMTSNGDEQIAVEALKSGALDYVVKTHDSLENLPHLAERAVREWEALQQRKEGEKLQDLQKEILEKIVLGEPVIDILNTLCLHIQEMIPESICSVMLLEETSRSLHVLSAPSAPKSLWAALDGLMPGEQAASCGTAAYTGHPVFVVDTHGDPRWSKYRDLATEFGIRGCWSIPIACEKEKTLGTFAISHRTSRSPTPFYRKLLETASYMAGITIQKRVAEDKLRASEDRYRDLYESAPCAYFTSQMDGRIMSVNTTAVQFLGYTKTNLVGRSILDIFAPTPNGRGKALELLQHTKDVNEVNGEQLEMQRANGTYLWISLTVRLIRDVKQNPIGWRAIVVDITQKKQAEEKVRESQKSLQQILDTMSAHVAILDEEGTILFVNGAWRRFAETNGARDTNYFVGKNYLHFCNSVSGMGQKEATAVSQGIRHVISAHRKDFFMEYPCDSPTEKHWFQLRVNRLDGSGPARALISHESITEVKEAEETLRSIVKGTSSVTSKDFLHSLVYHLASALHVQHALVAECTDVTNTKVRTLAFWKNGAHVPNIEYDLAGTPCEQVIKGEICYYPKDVQDLFPSDQELAQLNAQCYIGIPLQDSSGSNIGHLAILSSDSVELDTQTQSLLKIFAGRAQAELERHRAEEALKRSEGRLRQVIDLVPHFIFAKDRQGRYILANQAVAELYRIPVENLIGRTDVDLDPSKEEVDLFRRDDVDVIETGRVNVVEEEILTDPTGQHRYLQTTKIPFVFADTTTPSILGVAIDITARKQGEEALKLMERVFESSSDYLSVVGSDYRYQQVNPMYERRHQTPATDIVGKHIRDLHGEETFTELIQPHFDQCLKGDEVSYESWFHFKNGESRFMLVTYSPLRFREHSDAIQAVVVTCRDLTHRKRFEETLKEKEQRLRRLLEERRRISQDLHDHILQSLYAIGLMIAAAKHPIQLGSYQEASRHLDHSITQLNDAIGKIRSYIEDLSPETLHIQSFSSELNALVRSMKSTGSTTFKLKIDEEAATRLSKEQAQHLLNIARESMNNSVRHSHATAGSLSLRMTSKGLRFAILDNGVGLKDGWDSTKGQGLINMRARAEHLKGGLRMRSRPGRGTCVVVDLALNTNVPRNNRED